MWATSAFSHVCLESKAAAAGSAYKAVFQVGHGCAGVATTGLSVHIPAGFQGARPYPKAGWTLSTHVGKLAKPYDSHRKPVSEDVNVVSWTAASKEAALQDGHFDEFTPRGQLPDAAGPLWFKVLQSCGQVSFDWSEVPASGVLAKGLKSPAALLKVTAPVQLADAGVSSQPVQVPAAWVRATVPDQTASAAFMKVTAKSATRLVGIATPVAGVAELHEMKMSGEVMTMRPLAGLDLPAGKTVELKSGGYHVMLMGLRQTLTKDAMVPLTLTFRDAKGQESALAKAGSSEHSGHQH